MLPLLLWSVAIFWLWKNCFSTSFGWGMAGLLPGVAIIHGFIHFDKNKLPLLLALISGCWLAMTASALFSQITEEQSIWDSDYAEESNDGREDASRRLGTSTSAQTGDAPGPAFSRGAARVSGSDTTFTSRPLSPLEFSSARLMQIDVPLRNVRGHVGKYVEVELRNGRVHGGVVKSVRGGAVQLQVRRHGGTALLTFSNTQIASVAAFEMPRLPSDSVASTASAPPG